MIKYKKYIDIYVSFISWYVKYSNLNYTTIIKKNINLLEASLKKCIIQYLVNIFEEFARLNWQEANGLANNSILLFYLLYLCGRQIRSDTLLCWLIFVSIIC